MPEPLGASRKAAAMPIPGLRNVAKVSIEMWIKETEEPILLTADTLFH